MLTVSVFSLLSASDTLCEFASDESSCSISKHQTIIVYKNYNSYNNREDEIDYWVGNVDIVEMFISYFRFYKFQRGTHSKDTNPMEDHYKGKSTLW